MSLRSTGHPILSRLMLLTYLHFFSFCVCVCVCVCPCVCVSVCLCVCLCVCRSSVPPSPVPRPPAHRACVQPRASGCSSPLCLYRSSRGGGGAAGVWQPSLVECLVSVSVCVSLPARCRHPFVSRLCVPSPGPWLSFTFLFYLSPGDSAVLPPVDEAGAALPEVSGLIKVTLGDGRLPRHLPLKTPLKTPLRHL